METITLSEDFTRQQKVLSAWMVNVLAKHISTSRLLAEEWDAFLKTNDGKHLLSIVAERSDGETTSLADLKAAYATVRVREMLNERDGEDCDHCHVATLVADPWFAKELLDTMGVTLPT